MSRLQKYSWAILVLALLGVALSAVSLRSHYGSEETSYCSFDETFNCDLVNRSIYSSIADVPVALIGLLGYGMIAALSRFAPRSRRISALLVASALVGLGFALYLTYIEARVLGVWCILCISSQLIILAITVLSFVVFFGAVRNQLPVPAK
jgi:vitamin-K-epoxide reductase (warfarin-sensitive)